jgi:E3 ubiquitin-protein ligase RNF115/126
MQSVLRGVDITNLHSHHADHTQLIDELPEMTVDEKSKIPDDKLECMICMSNFQIGEKVKIMPCTHFFHTGCIREWFKANDTCPICKHSVSEEGNEGSEGH